MLSKTFKNSVCLEKDKTNDQLMTEGFSSVFSMRWAKLVKQYVNAKQS